MQGLRKNKKIYHNRLMMNYILSFFIFVGIALTLYQFLYNRGLNGDEACLAINVFKRNFLGLLKPLEYDQVAPIGFLYITKLFTILFSKTDWSLRIFPLICYLISIPLYYKLTFKLSKNKTLSLLSCSLYSMSIQIIRYSTEAKQYQTDVLCTILILLATITFKENPNKKNGLILLLTGCISVWFSNIAVIILFTAGLFLLYKNRKNINSLRNIIIIISGWLVSFSIYYIFFIHNHPSKAFMLSFWTINHNGLFSKNIFSIDYIFFIIEKIRMTLLLLDFRGFMLFILAILFFVIYPVLLIKKQKVGLLFLTLFPIITHFFLSSFKMYPYFQRLILYFIPILMFIYSYLFWQGLRFINKRIININIINISFLILSLMFTMIKTYNYFPYKENDGRKVMAWINKNISKEDKIIYMTYDGYPVSLFYKNYYINTRNKKYIRFDDKDSVIIFQSLKKYLYKNKDEKIWIAGDGAMIKDTISFLKKQKEIKVKYKIGFFACGCYVRLHPFFKERLKIIPNKDKIEGAEN